MMTAREICEDDGRSRGGEVGLEAASSIRTWTNSGDVESKPDLANEVGSIDSWLNVKLMVDCR